jgi:hypothetical protein
MEGGGLINPKDADKKKPRRCGYQGFFRSVKRDMMMAGKPSPPLKFITLYASCNS